MTALHAIYLAGAAALAAFAALVLIAVIVAGYGVVLLCQSIRRWTR